MKIEKKEFIKKGDILLKTYGLNNCHSFYMGKLLPLLGINELYDTLEFKNANTILEKETAKILNIKYYTDGNQIIYTYAFSKADEELEKLSDSEYSKKINNIREKHMKIAWKKMFEIMYDVFLKITN